MKTVYTTPEEVVVKNCTGSSKKSSTCPNCGNWITHWETLSFKIAGTCSIKDCKEKATDGAHVLRPNAKCEDYKTHPYILPMCHSHNLSTETLKVKSGSTFVWANVQETCGKE